MYIEAPTVAPIIHSGLFLQFCTRSRRCRSKIERSGLRQVTVGAGKPFPAGMWAPGQGVRREATHGGDLP